MLGIIIVLLYGISHLILKRPYEAFSIITPTLEIRKLRQEMFKCFVHGQSEAESRFEPTTARKQVPGGQRFLSLKSTDMSQEPRTLLVIK